MDEKRLDEKWVYHGNHLNAAGGNTENGVLDSLVFLDFYFDVIEQ